MIETYRRAGQLLGVAPSTVLGWVRSGIIAEPPWTEEDITAADAQARARGQVRGITSEHGTPERWAAGCGCAECSAAHSEDTSRRRRRQRAEWWAEREDVLLEGLANGLPYVDALSVAEVTWQAITERRRRDADFAERMDMALMQGRPDVAHGRNAGWRAGCRCPECREYHEATRRK